jgi:hypothetical protein
MVLTNQKEERSKETSPPNVVQCSTCLSLEEYLSSSEYLKFGDKKTFGQKAEMETDTNSFDVSSLIS